MKKKNLNFRNFKKNSERFYSIYNDLLALYQEKIQEKILKDFVRFISIIKKKLEYFNLLEKKKFLKKF